MDNKKTDDVLVWAACAAEAALSKKATDVITIKVKPALVIVDYFVIATAANQIQLNAIVEAVEEALRTEHSIKPIGREGFDNSQGQENHRWALLDYGDIVVHVFAPETREFYRLETLYNDADIITYG